MRCYVCSTDPANFSKSQLSKRTPVCKVCTTTKHTCDGCGWEAQFSNFKFTDRETEKASVVCQRCRAGDDGPMYCPYDGPNDPDRYEGHGVWDDADGYCIS
ncbi:MAG: hypothetical protein CMB11_01775 [Euryarchaeota archaeon]|nr:hypothetical protein [Euryarchaeota archaeon]